MDTVIRKCLAPTPAAQWLASKAVTEWCIRRRRERSETCRRCGERGIHRLGMCSGCCDEVSGQ